MEFRRLEEALFRGLMLLAVLLVAASLAGVLALVLARGIPALSVEMITQAPKGGFYLGKEGGVLNAITGSLCLAIGATIISLLLGLPIVFYLQKEYAGRSRMAALTRLSLDLIWGVPSIVIGAFGFILMVYLGLRASLLGGIIALSLVELPIMARAMQEVVRMVPVELKESSYALGATRLETSLRVVWRHALPGIVTGILLAFGRGIGDAASILFTAGYTDRLPSALSEPVGSLPLVVFQLSQSPMAEVREKAYASAAILLVIVVLLSIIARALARKWEAQIAR